MIPGSNMNDLIGTNATFMSGVVEGFYGKPWTSEQRKILFRRMKKMGLNTYLYAPKDDCKHRMYWRELYSVEEADHITSLISAAEEYNVDFVYAISPGLDITFSSSKDVTLLKKKLEQVSSFGCKSFALLFDDIEVEMCEADKAIFQSFASAQVSVTNEVYQHLSQPNFLFCPTEYCASRAMPNVMTSEYLNTVGSKLLPAIDILWTGPKVVSHKISMESIKELAAVLRRAPVIWDNIHANDYDRKRLFLGPYDGRSTSLIPHLRGVLTNPNCEFEGNYMAMHTLAQWTKANPASSEYPDALPSGSPLQRAEMQLETESECSETPACDSDPGYSPRQALAVALVDWYEEMCMDARPSLRRPAYPVSPPLIPTCSINTATSSSVLPTVCTNLNELNNVEVNSSYAQPAMSAVPLNSFVDSDTDSDESVEQEPEGEPMDCALTPPSSANSSLASSPDLKVLSDLPLSPSLLKCDNLAPMAVDSPLPVADSVSTCSMTQQEMSFLVECFYLPFEHGSRPVTMLQDFIWLKNNAYALHNASCAHATPEQKEAAAHWHAKAVELRGHFNAYWTMLDHFANIPNQAIVHEIYPYLWDLKSIFSVVQTFLEWMGANPNYREAFSNGTQEPWVFQGGLQAEFQRLLPIQCCADLLNPALGPPVPVPIFNVRPYKHTDESAVYEVCRQTCREAYGSQHPDYPDLLPDRLVGAHLTLSPQHCFVIENVEGEVCGYVMGALDVKTFTKQMEVAWIPEMREKYPLPESSESRTPTQEIIQSFHDDEVFMSDKMCSQFPSVVQMQVSQKEDPTALHRACLAAFAALHASGSPGAHVELPTAAKDLIGMYAKLGFVHMPGTSPQDSSTTVARLI